MTETPSEAVLRRLKTYGWCQGRLGDIPGPNCLNGALLYCSMENRPTWDVIFDIWYRSGMNGLSIASWNDEPGRSFEEVEAMLERAIAIEREEQSCSQSH